MYWVRDHLFLFLDFYQRSYLWVFVINIKYYPPLSALLSVYFFQANSFLRDCSYILTVYVTAFSPGKVKCLHRGPLVRGEKSVSCLVYISVFHKNVLMNSIVDNTISIDGIL